jgi:hypothetical protein
VESARASPARFFLDVILDVITMTDKRIMRFLLSLSVWADFIAAKVQPYGLRYWLVCSGGGNSRSLQPTAAPSLRGFHSVLSGILTSKYSLGQV